MQDVRLQIFMRYAGFWPRLGALLVDAIVIGITLGRYIMRSYFGKFFLVLTVSVLLTSCAIGPESLLRTHAYEGAQKSATEMATVFAVWKGVGGELTFICEVDGKSHRKLGAISSCPSVVYLLPGRHDLTVEYRWANLIGTVVVPVNAEAGKTYRVTGTSTDKKQVLFNIQEMPVGFALTYKDVAPVFFSDGARPNSRVDPSMEK